MLNMNEKVALFHARSLKSFCTDFKDLCYKEGHECPLYDKKSDICILGCPMTWPEDLISKEREE